MAQEWLVQFMMGEDNTISIYEPVDTKIKEKIMEQKTGWIEAGDQLINLSHVRGIRLQKVEKTVYQQPASIPESFW